MYKVIHIDLMENQNNIDDNFNPKEVLISFIYILFLVFLTYIDELSIGFQPYIRHIKMLQLMETIVLE